MLGVNSEVLVGFVLVSGLMIFLVGAVAWRMAYEQPLAEALRAIHADRRRRSWIHLWMIAGVFATQVGVVGFTAISATRTALIAAMAAVVYGLGAVTWIISLVFRLAVVPWAAERAEADGQPPEGFAALNSWAGTLYVLHMIASYAAFAILGAAILESGTLPSWLGWAGVTVGIGFLAGFVATRFSGPFNPPFWAHSYTALVGATLLNAG